MDEYERDQQIAELIERAHTKFRESQKGYRGQLINARSSGDWWIANEALLLATTECKRLTAEVSVLRKAAQDYVEAESGGFLASPIECARVFRKALAPVSGSDPTG